MPVDCFSLHTCAPDGFVHLPLLSLNRDALLYLLANEATSEQILTESVQGAGRPAVLKEDATDFRGRPLETGGRSAGTDFPGLV